MAVSEEKKKRINELVTTLNCASEKYYAQDDEIMTNYEYDALYDELAALEEETGYVLSNSPTVRVGYEAVDELPKVRHERPMLSLAKTKDRDELGSWLGDREGLLSWKLDGLTVVLTYNDGKLAKAVTRGNGEIGEIVTNNARTFINLPHSIDFKEELVIRGEACIGYADFNAINESISEADAKYKNPRNLCSGSVRQLDPAVTAKRRVRFFAFSLVRAEGMEFDDSHEKEFEFLTDLGFDVVEHKRVNGQNVSDAVDYYENKIREYDIPSDGLVLLIDSIAYGQGLGTTAKFPRNAIAFKWQDETAETVLREVFWSASRTGLINPVAVFDPVELEGTSVSRASVHNVSIVRSLKLGIGDRILVYKANMIIPQIAENITKSGNLPIPGSCPVCGAATEIAETEGTAYLYCTGSECPAKQTGAFAQFVSRDALNIEGLSEATIEKLLNLKLLRSFGDLYRLHEHRAEIEAMEGFGRKSCDNLLDSIERSKDTELYRVLYGVGIDNVGVSTAKLICRHFGNSSEELAGASTDELSSIEGVGPVIAASVRGFFEKPEKLQVWNELTELLNIKAADDLQDPAGRTLQGLSFCITGSLNGFANRNELKELIESRGGKVTGSVSGNTTCLINNDSTSGSSKNTTARKLGIPVLTEEEFMTQYMVV